MSVESASSLIAYQVTLIIVLLMVGLTVITNLRTMEKATQVGEQESTGAGERCGTRRPRPCIGTISCASDHLLACVGGIRT